MYIVRYHLWKMFLVWRTVVNDQKFQQHVSVHDLYMCICIPYLFHSLSESSSNYLHMYIIIYEILLYITSTELYYL